MHLSKAGGKESGKWDVEVGGPEYEDEPLPEDDSEDESESEPKRM